jgi:hypothetical protein
VLNAHEYRVRSLRIVCGYNTWLKLDVAEVIASCSACKGLVTIFLREIDFERDGALESSPSDTMLQSSLGAPSLEPRELAKELRGLFIVS